MFAYCENNPISRSDPNGEWVHLVVGAAIGVVTQVAMDMAFGQTSTLADYVGAAIGGTLAASGIGFAGSVVANAAIGGTTYLANCDIKGEKVDAFEFVAAVRIGALSGAVGGKGTDAKRLIGIIKTSKTYLKTLVSPKKIAMYKGKIKIANKNGAISFLRFIAASATANGVNHARKSS